MIDSATLFLKTLEDLEKRLHETEPYEILLIAGLLRKLFLDDHPLVDRINASVRMKLVFVVGIPEQTPKPDSTVMFWSVQDGLDPETGAPFRKPRECSRDQFFSSVVSIAAGHAYTIRDIVQFEANVVGAVHAGSPRSEKDAALHQVDSTLSIGGYGSSLRQLLAIGRVALKALHPLREAVRGT